MSKKALRKSNIREILKSKARFFSILLIIFLGVCFYAGIKATGPDMINTAETYYKDQKLMDTKIVSPIGLEAKELDKVKKEDYVKEAVGSYTLDVTEKKANSLLRVMSYDTSSNNQLNQPRIVEGRLPEKSGEIALDKRAIDAEMYQIGDQIKFDTKKDSVKETSYKVVGIINSPMYIDQVSRGNTNIGKGSIDLFGIIPKEDFDMEVYTEIYVTYQGMDKKISYSDSYKEEINKKEKKLKKLLEPNAVTRSNELKKENKAKLAEGKEQLADGRQQIEIGKEQLFVGKRQVEEQEKSFKQAESMGQVVPNEASMSLKEAQKELKIQEEKIKKEEQNLSKKENEFTKQEKNIDKMKEITYTYQTRDDNPAYSEYKDNADRISSIATVFPVFFFLIAALICLTTMTRMVDGKRGEIGTLKALGYSNFEIAKKFILYATLASIVGSLLGLVIGFNIFPTIIFNAYGSLYNLPEVIITYYASYSIQSVVVALLCTLLSSMIVLRVDLLSTPAVLMRPKAPKPGKRIWLEKISWLWSKMNFNQKVTARNLFRYKQRMLMTVLGIAGCMAMIITGFGLKDSIGDIVDIQFSKIWHYDATVMYSPEATKEETKAYEEKRDNLNNYKDHLILSQKTVEVTQKGYNKQEVVVDTPKDISQLNKFITFNNRKTGESYKLDDSGVIINEKLGKLYDLKEGDSLKIKASGDKVREVKVKHIVENYAMHFIYMTPEYYNKIFGEKPDYNVDLLNFNKEISEKQEESLAEDLMNTKKAINVSFTSQIGKAMDDTMGSLNVVVWVLIISAAMLAFIVLYNLTNINISERIRELSTIKVLGFYDKEVTMYVYRENNILTLFGILLGCVLGKLLHAFVLQTAEVDMMMFPPDIHGISYLYSAALTVLFSLVVMFFMHRRLKKVDMIEALKSTE